MLKSPTAMCRVACCLLVTCALSAAGTTRAEAAEGWPHRRVHGPFVIYSDFPLHPSDGLLAELGRLQSDLVGQLRVPPTREAVQLYWFAERTTYEAYLARHFPDLPARRALFIKQRGPGMMLAHVNPDFVVDVRHECTHALLHAVLPLVPLWLDEGLAEYFEVARPDRLAGHPHLSAIRRRLSFGRIAPLAELEKLGQVGDMRLPEYQDAWAWVHFLLHGPPEARAELQAYLAALASERPAGSLRLRLEHRLPDLEQQLRRHFLQSIP